MNTIQIDRILQRTVPTFRGVYSRNRLPRRMKEYPFSLVANTDPDNQNGQHWIAIHVDEHDVGEYYDPYGFPPIHQPFENFLNRRCREWTYNHVTVQHPASTVCGQHCIVYLVLRSRGYEMYEITRMLAKDINANTFFVDDFVKQL